MTRFRIAPHGERPGEQMVEVWIGDQFVGALYPGDRDDEVKFVSKHLMSAVLDRAFPPAVLMMLNLQGSRQ